MLGEIESGRKELKQANDELDQRVQQRTQQLSQSNEELVQEVAERKKAERELQTMRDRHVETARQAGMAEVASAVLHNVGNVLNSVNVSSNLIVDKLNLLGISDLTQAAGLIESHLDDLGAFVTEDERGRHLPNFLIELSRQMAACDTVIQEEARLMKQSVEHIGDIISVQQSNAGLSGLVENVRLADILDEAIRINLASAHRHHLDVVREFEHVPTVAIDRQKVLLVTVNLVSNARHALKACRKNDRRVVIRLLRHSASHARIEVEDNGVGIPPENLSRIFNHGFTTRKGGHGFGLHSAALTAKELGGELNAHSDGPDMGATFVFELPVNVVEATPTAGVEVVEA